MPRPISTAAETLALALLAAGPAGAWSREGHMLSAAIAYDDLMAKDPATASAIANIIDHHPDRGTFQVATEGAFDPHTQEALLTQPSDEPEGAVIQVLQKGYRLGDVVLRPARVVVSAGSDG